MLVILHDRDTLLHQTVEILGSKLIPALESPARIDAILDALHASNHKVRELEAGNSGRLLDLAEQTHAPAYLEHLRTVHRQWRSAGLIEDDGHVLPECFWFPTSAGNPRRPPKDLFARAGYYAFDMSTGIMADSYRAMIASANLALEGASMLTETSGQHASTVDTVIALCRPPGHHCDGQRAGGYCYINNAAVAVSRWRRSRPSTAVGILDLDFHHGNGTQEIFYDDGGVMYVSIHGEDEFPYYTGSAAEGGTGAGRNSNVNLPLRTGSSMEDYCAKLSYGLTRLRTFGPAFLVISLGFDTFHLDPLGHFEIETADYERIAKMTRQKLQGIPTLIVLEGGYVIEHLGANMLSFIRGWEGA